LLSLELQNYLNLILSSNSTSPFITLIPAKTHRYESRRALVKCASKIAFEALETKLLRATLKSNNKQCDVRYAKTSQGTQKATAIFSHGGGACFEY